MNIKDDNPNNRIKDYPAHEVRIKLEEAIEYLLEFSGQTAKNVSMIVLEVLETINNYTTIGDLRFSLNKIKEEESKLTPKLIIKHFKQTRERSYEENKPKVDYSKCVTYTEFKRIETDRLKLEGKTFNEVYPILSSSELTRSLRDDY